MSMARRGHRVHFVCYDVPRRLDRFTENVFFHEVEVTEYPLFSHSEYALALASKMVEVITFENLDILHVHYAVPHATSAYLAKQVFGPKSPKIITTLHGTDITLVGNERSYLPITRFSIVQSDGVTAPSKFLKHATYDKLNVSTDFPIEVIANFVDTEKFSPAPERNLEELKRMFCTSVKDSFSADGKILIHVSNFRPVKRIVDVIKTFAIVNLQIPSRLLLVGDGPERSSAENLVRELGLVGKVCFLGKQENFVNLLQKSDVFLLPSDSESFGLAALEAMSCGVPVVAANVGGIPEVVKHGETGFLAAVGDVEEMSRHVIQILSDEALAKRMSKAARQLAVDNYTEAELTAQYENYYYKILGRA